MPGLRDLIATLETLASPRILATRLGAGPEPGPVRRELLEAAPEGTDGFAQAARAVLAGASAQILGAAPGEAGWVLVERLEPRRLPPWLHCAVQAQARGGVAVLATVTGREGEAPAEAGERFVYDHRNHGLLPMDGRFSLDLQRACERARAQAKAAA